MAILLSKDIWRKLKLVLKGQLNPQSFNVWLAPTQAVSFKDDIIDVEVPNKFFKGWLEEHYSEKIAQTLSELAGKNIGVNYIINEKWGGWAEEKITNPSRAPKPALALFNINPKYTFDDFVVGSSNRFAHAASLAVAEKPAAAYNPLFLYGGVGLGKTHLMQAICHHLIIHSPHIKPFYISSEKFTNQLINAIQNRTTLKFREKYRNVDVLLVDDIQFIAGKESTQEEFFHTFNALREAHKQIVISSDRPPKD
ncbi:MAG: ATP-binding protein, partial [Candidatus Omnitrophica bacterium]|nr:ATP-binding protein [Candidatus Omnitrophota bacterium]